MYSSFFIESFFSTLDYFFRELDLFSVQILAGELRQFVDLLLERIVDAFVAVAEIDGGVPHLEIEIGCFVPIVKIAPFTTFKNVRFFSVMDRVAMRTNYVLNGQ
jgi:hypothetical protein